MDEILSSPSSDVFLKKATITLAAIFFLSSLILAVRTSRETTKSLLEKSSMPITPVQVPAQVPAEQSEELPPIENTSEEPETP